MTDHRRRRRLIRACAGATTLDLWTEQVRHVESKAVEGFARMVAHAEIDGRSWQFTASRDDR